MNPSELDARLRSLGSSGDYDADQMVEVLMDLAVAHERIALRFGTVGSPEASPRSAPVARAIECTLGVDGMASSHPCSDPSLFRHLLARLSVVLRRDGVQLSPYCFVLSFARSGVRYDVVATNNLRDGFSVVITRHPSGP